jgi:hypothetical protein
VNSNLLCFHFGVYRKDAVVLGTMDSSAFKDKERKDGSGKRDVLFNAPGDGGRHGHVVEKVDKDGNRTYPFVRDVEGRVYADDRKRNRGSRESGARPER